MSHVTTHAEELPFLCADIENKARNLYDMVLRKIKLSGLDTSEFLDRKTLLRRAGFSQNGRNRLVHLSEEEINAICAHCPSEQVLWSYFVSEIQMLLSKMDQVRKAELSLDQTSFMGRPYVTKELIATVAKLTRLKFLSDQGITLMKESVLRKLLVSLDNDRSIVQYIDLNYEGNGLKGNSITIRSAIRFLDLYRGELMAPPRLKCRRNFDDYDLHTIQTRDFSWMDDGGEEYLEAIRDIPFETYYDAMPQFETVLDWFLATKPVLDKNRINRGWNYLEKLSSRWHELTPSLCYDDEYIANFPSWNCLVDDHRQEWLASVPADNPYKIVPLVTPMQMLEESKSMHHCVAFYVPTCIEGNDRVFSVREKINDERVATVQLELRSNRWEIVQLKGKCNKEMLYTMFDSRDSLAEILETLAGWYNSKTLQLSS